MKLIPLLLILSTLGACAGGHVRPKSDSEPALVPLIVAKPTEKKAQSLPPPTQVVVGDTYEVRYPASWEIFRDYYGTDSMAVSFPKNEEDQFRENINLIFEVIEVKNHQAYYKANLHSLKSNLTNFQALSTTTGVSESGLSFTDLVYTHETKGVTAKNRVVFFYENGIGYVITTTSLPDTFDSYFNTFDRVIQSFNILP